ncbi:hypothetical protein BUALT_Bualt14G0064000 [Buddleja alternifolia]|uniref:Bidirectional sugar transporter SWEET n=1 Tax=Buddleja alternifolia TaxID=168488 RepID=A0AAV6WSF1_9LAMI|nr:hypothetical protein BUALT_Bualt14G0064000 [Buddleja alternifolia]
MEISFVIGVLGNIFASLLFISPAKTFWRIVKKRSTEEFESIPYIILLLNASLWTYYGIIKPELLLVTINGFGAALGVIYVFIYLLFAPSKIKVKTFAMVGTLNVGFLVGAILITSFAMSRHAQVNTAGILCVCITIISFGSPLAVMKTVVTTKSVEFMPFFLTFFYFLVATTWGLYGILIHDTFILIPNSIGFFLGVAQLSLYAWYRNYPKPSEIKDDDLEEGKPRKSEDFVLEEIKPAKSEDCVLKVGKPNEHLNNNAP